MDESMDESMNMVCPSCHTFQPRAMACSQCGVIVEKVLNANKGPVEKIVIAPDKPKTNKLWILLLLTCIILYLSKDNEEEVRAVSQVASEQSQTPEQGQLDSVAAVNPDVAMESQRDKVIAKLQALKSTLHMLSMEGRALPSNEDGLYFLVDEGYLAESDITDEWNNTFVYRIEWGEETALEREYSIFVHSRGPDGISGNSDDIVMP